MFFLLGVNTLRADEALLSDDEFLRELDNVKNPFEDGYPKPKDLPQKPKPKIIAPKKSKPKPKPKPKRHVIKRVIIIPPELDLQGVIVGDDMHQAIIDGQIVPLKGIIKGAQIYAVTKEGIGFIFKGKKFFLKVE